MARRRWILGACALVLGTGLAAGTPSAPVARTATAGVATVSTATQRLATYERPRVSPRSGSVPASPTAPTVGTVQAPLPAQVARAHRIAAPAPLVARTVTPAAPAYRSRLVSNDGAINTGVGFYSDCSGRTVLSHSIAAIETCVRGRTYFVGHNPGVFSGMFREGIGSIITWYDGNGGAHRLRIIGIRTWRRFAGVPPLLAGATAEFQTCISADGTIDRLMDAGPA